MLKGLKHHNHYQYTCTSISNIYICFFEDRDGDEASWNLSLLILTAPVTKKCNIIFIIYE